MSVQRGLREVRMMSNMCSPSGERTGAYSALKSRSLILGDLPTSCLTLPRIGPTVWATTQMPRQRANAPGPA